MFVQRDYSVGLRLDSRDLIMTVTVLLDSLDVFSSCFICVHSISFFILLRLKHFNLNRDFSIRNSLGFDKPRAEWSRAE